MRYTKRDVDFVAIYVIPDDSWFIIPVESVRHKAVDLPPRNAAPRSQWHQFRDAWHLLGAHPNRCVTLVDGEDTSSETAAQLTTASVRTV